MFEAVEYHGWMINNKTHRFDVLAGKVNRVEEIKSSSLYHTPSPRLNWEEFTSKKWMGERQNGQGFEGLERGVEGGQPGREGGIGPKEE